LLEVFVNRRACVTQVLEHGDEKVRAEPFVEGSGGKVRSFDVWELNRIWS